MGEEREWGQEGHKGTGKGWEWGQERDRRDRRGDGGTAMGTGGGRRDGRGQQWGEEGTEGDSGGDGEEGIVGHKGTGGAQKRRVMRC